MMVSAIIIPTAKKPLTVPTRMAPSRSTLMGMNGSPAVITRHANRAHSAADTASSAINSGDIQA